MHSESFLAEIDAHGSCKILKARGGNAIFALEETRKDPNQTFCEIDLEDGMPTNHGFYVWEGVYREEPNISPASFNGPEEVISVDGYWEGVWRDATLRDIINFGLNKITVTFENPRPTAV